ncbi:hypothetical protein GCM10029976_012430 [Kribbella albertanoniae]|uniref:hypothetical protein n=1 Tax=Kribbella albertanoniae TaxID=1266829 RepID=UPI00192DEF41|nr:hypothetical protein [Kribbella albertanoniae]
MKTIIRRAAQLAATALIAAITLTATGAAAAPLSSAPQNFDVMYNALPCVAGGPAPADAAMANTLNPLLAKKMRGHMTPYNTSCARAVVQAVQERGLNQRAAAIAIATVIVETSIANLDGGDLDSVGLYQQRATWGSFAERTNPVIATGKFLDTMERFYPNGSWNTAAIGDVAADVQRPAAQYRYRYGVEAGDAQIIADKLWTTPVPTTGRFWHNVRWSDGTWSGANVADNNTAVAQVVEAGSPLGDLHVLTLSGGKVYHNVRWANGTWNGANMVDGNGNISRVAVATTPNGDLHVLTVVGGKLYHNVRWADGSWSGAGLADNSGAISDIATAGSPVGDLHVLTVAGGKTFHNVRWANGTWNGANVADANGSIARVAAATTPNGDLHVLTQVGGRLYHNARWSDGSWSGAGLADNNGAITEIAAAGSPAGDLHVVTLAGGKASHNVRWASGSWSGANVADGNGSILMVGAATTPNGDMHLATVRP